MMPDMEDALLGEECAEFRDLLASYIVGCEEIARADASEATAQTVTHLRRRLLDAGRTWRACLKRISGKPARGKAGLVAKVQALDYFMAHYPGEVTDATLLVKSVVADVIFLLADGE